ncbi:unnamed protein product [Closterium sp. NIES-53]
MDKSPFPSFSCPSPSSTLPHRQSAQHVESLRSEVDVLLAVRGLPCVVRVEQVVEEPHAVHVVMEACGQGDLFDYIAHFNGMPELHATCLFRQIVVAVAGCHSLGIIHRDIKPENIFLSLNPAAPAAPAAAETTFPNACTNASTSAAAAAAAAAVAVPASPDPAAPPVPPTSLLMRLGDFGLALFLHTQPGAEARGRVGSSYYMAPEVVRGGRYGLPADVWSLGVILYIMLSAARPAGLDMWSDFELTQSTACGESLWDSSSLKPSDGPSPSHLTPPSILNASSPLTTPSYLSQASCSSGRHFKADLQSHVLFSPLTHSHPSPSSPSSTPLPPSASLPGFVPFWGATSLQTFDAICSGRLDLSSPVCLALSPAAKALLCAMLSLDPAARPTAHQVLSHPWLSVNKTVVEAPQKSLLAHPWVPEHEVDFETPQNPVKPDLGKGLVETSPGKGVSDMGLGKGLVDRGGVLALDGLEDPRLDLLIGEECAAQQTILWEQQQWQEQQRRRQEQQRRRQEEQRGKELLSQHAEQQQQRQQQQQKQGHLVLQQCHQYDILSMQHEEQEQGEHHNNHHQHQQQQQQQHHQHHQHPQQQQQHQHQQHHEQQQQQQHSHHQLFPIQQQEQEQQQHLLQRQAILHQQQLQLQAYAAVEVEAQRLLVHRQQFLRQQFLLLHLEQQQLQQQQQEWQEQEGQQGTRGGRSNQRLRSFSSADVEGGGGTDQDSGPSSSGETEETREKGGAIIAGGSMREVREERAVRAVRDDIMAGKQAVKESMLLPLFSQEMARGVRARSRSGGSRERAGGMKALWGRKERAPLDADIPTVIPPPDIPPPTWQQWRYQPFQARRFPDYPPNRPVPLSNPLACSSSAPHSEVVDLSLSLSLGGGSTTAAAASAGPWVPVSPRQMPPGGCSSVAFAAAAAAAAATAATAAATANDAATDNAAAPAASAAAATAAAVTATAAGAAVKRGVWAWGKGGAGLVQAWPDLSSDEGRASDEGCASDEGRASVSAEKRSSDDGESCGDERERKRARRVAWDACGFTGESGPPPVYVVEGWTVQEEESEGKILRKEEEEAREKGECGDGEKRKGGDWEKGQREEENEMGRRQGKETFEELLQQQQQQKEQQLQQKQQQLQREQCKGEEAEEARKGERGQAGAFHKLQQQLLELHRLEQAEREGRRQQQQESEQEQINTHKLEEQEREKLQQQLLELHRLEQEEREWERQLEQQQRQHQQEGGTERATERAAERIAERATEGAVEGAVDETRADKKGNMEGMEVYGSNESAKEKASDKQQRPQRVTAAGVTDWCVTKWRVTKWGADGRKSGVSLGPESAADAEKRPHGQAEATDRDQPGFSPHGPPQLPFPRPLSRLRRNFYPHIVFSRLGPSQLAFPQSPASGQQQPHRQWQQRQEQQQHL